jgi:ornithine carbamoyltransferase
MKKSIILAIFIRALYSIYPILETIILHPLSAVKGLEITSKVLESRILEYMKKLIKLHISKSILMFFIKYFEEF